MISNSSENISVDTMDNATLNRRKDFKKSDIFVSVHIRNEPCGEQELKNLLDPEFSIIRTFLELFGG